MVVEGKWVLAHPILPDACTSHNAHTRDGGATVSKTKQHHVQVRVKPREARAWLREARRHDLTLAQLVRRTMREKLVGDGELGGHRMTGALTQQCPPGSRGDRAAVAG